MKGVGSQGLVGLPGWGLLGTFGQSSSNQPTKLKAGKLSSSEPQEAFSTNPKGPGLRQSIAAETTFWIWNSAQTGNTNKRPRRDIQMYIYIYIFKPGQRALPNSHSLQSLLDSTKNTARAYERLEQTEGSRPVCLRVQHSSG